MRSGSRLVLALALAVVVASTGTYLQRTVGSKPTATATAGTASSGAWFCPHGGGKGWTVTLEIANPGTQAVNVRLSGLSSGKPGRPQSLSVPPRAEIQVPAVSSDRAATSLVEYFGGWVAAGWVARAGGGETGVAAEPCAPAAGRTLLLPDGVTQRGEDGYLIVMNPFGTDAILSIALYTADSPPIRPKDWSDFALGAGRSTAFRINAFALGRSAVTAAIRVSVGRVAASSLGVSSASGVRSVEAISAPTSRSILPAGLDQAKAQLAVGNVGRAPARFAAAVSATDSDQIAPGLEGVSIPPESAKAFDVDTSGPAALTVNARSPGVATAIRAIGQASHDEAGSAGSSAPHGSWVVLPTVAASPATPALTLTNPGEGAAKVTLTLLPVSGKSLVPTPKGNPPDPQTLDVPAGRTVTAPKRFVEAGPADAVLVVARSGSIVAASSSYSAGANGVGGYSIATGVPVPPEEEPG